MLVTYFRHFPIETRWTEDVIKQPTLFQLISNDFKRVFIDLTFVIIEKEKYRFENQLKKYEKYLLNIEKLFLITLFYLWNYFIILREILTLTIEF